jgi:hypothetical protein
MSGVINSTYTTGTGTVVGPGINAFVQSVLTLTYLRGFVGASGMSVMLAGGTAPGDGVAGLYYWSLGNYSDNNSTVIVPSGAAGIGAWLLAPLSTTSGSSTINGNLTVTGTTALQGLSATSGTFSTTLAVTGATTLSGTLAVAFGASFSATGTGLSVTNTASIGTLNLTNPLTPMFGGTGINASAAANGTLLIGNASGFTLGTLTGTANNLTVTNGSGAVTLKASAAQTPGTATNDNAAAGNLGEYVSSSIASGSAVPLTTGTGANITSISLNAGDWDVSGSTNYVSAGSTVVTVINAWTSTTSATPPTAPNNGGQGGWNGSVTGQPLLVVVGSQRFSLATTTTIYLSTEAVFTTSTLTAYGFIGARRAR